ncbi:MAG: cation:proton antiporter [Bradymonadales bacterium]|jgi:Kef-type K+ transport system membrane component KefB
MEYVIERFSHLFTLPLTEEVAVFALLLLLILIAPIVTTRLKLPSLLGLILFGVIIGPHALNIIQNDGAVKLLSTIGLLYIMFIAALEMDINQFKVHQNQSIVYSGLAMLGPAVVVFPLVYFVYGLPVLESVLVTTMMATHTLVAYPTVSRYGVANDSSVAITIGGTILLDTVVLIALAVILGMHQGSLTAGFWMQLVSSILLFLLIMYFGVGKLGEWFFTNFHNERYLQYIFVLFAVFLSALLAELAGLEAIVGAFGAGLVLNRLIPRSSPLMYNVEFVGNAIFIPLFLISVGMLVDLKVLFSGPYILILAFALSVAGILGKWLGAFSLQKLYKLTKTQRGLIFGLSTARVAATLAIAIVGHKAGLINDAFLNAAILIILATCIVASVITERAAKTMAVEKETSLPGEQDVIAGEDEHILLPIANVNNIGKLFDFSLLLKSPTSENPITILTVVPNDEEAEKNIATNRKKLNEYIKTAGSPEANVKVVATIDTSVPDGICRTSREYVADLLILGWPKPGILERIIGEKWACIINQVDKMIVLASLESPTSQTQRLVLLTAPMAELEHGFEIWVQKVVKIALEWSLSIHHFGEVSTSDAMREVIERNKLSAKLESSEFNEWNDFLVLSREIKDTDLIVVISARRSTLSYLPLFENMPSKLEKYFAKNNKLIVFPKQAIDNSIINSTIDV